MFNRSLICLGLVSIATACADVIINEISATQPDRLLRWDANDQPYAGSGAPWWSNDFDDSAWQTGATPLGFDLGAITTNLSAVVKGVTPSVYARKEFSVAPGAVGKVILSINCNDGFIVWINGKELARCNMGPEKSHIYHDQLAHRAAANSTATSGFDLGDAGDILITGDNVLAIQVANSNITSSLRLEMSLDAGGTALIPLSSDVRYFPGLIEPGSDLYEPAAVAEGSSDWIELHNNGASAVDLDGWSLSDNPDIPDKWAFPDGTTLDAGGYLVVLADNPDSPIIGARYLHTNFKLSSAGDYIGLFDNTNTMQSQIAPVFPKQFRAFSYGTSAGGGTIAYLDPPTPGKANSATSYADKVDAPDFGIEGGFFDTSVTVALSTHTAGATIRYTTDGTVPTGATGALYVSPLALARISNKKGHVIRARAFLDGMIPSNTKTNTYLIGQDARLRTAPALIYSADLPRSLYDPYGVLAIEGGIYSNSRWQPADKNDYNNVFNRGRAYERPIHAEYYFADGSAGFRTDCGVRIAASSYSRPRMRLSSVNSSPWPADPVQKPSFNLYFRNEYGNPDVSLPLNGQNAPVKTFEQFRIRAGKNDIRNPFIIDELVRRLSRDMGQPASTGSINTLYVNGELKGFYNMVERLRTPNFRAYHSDDPNAEWDVLQFEGNDNIADGDKVAFVEMIARLNAPETVANWEAALEFVDPVNIADYFILNIYTAMWDWPHNNWVAARERSPLGRYRLYVWDAEGGFDNRGGRTVSTNMINSFIIGTSNGAGGSNGTEGELRDIWNGLNRWEEFRLLFADRVNKHLFNGGVLDDRDFDNSHIHARNEELVEEFDDLLSFMNNQTVTNTHTRNWATGTTRRNYLFGPNRESFRNHDLWPTATPPELSQFGGSVTAGYPLNLTNEIGDIYYTIDGSDPRLPGGTPNPSATSQGGSVLDVDLMERGSDWNYHDLGENLGSVWRGPGYDDQAWAAGPAPLGFGGITNTTIATQMNTDRNLTAYVRNSFEVDDAAAYFDLRISVHVDGGAVVYINGAEALRDGMPDGVITFNTIAATDGNEGVFDEFQIDPALLVDGTNTIAVEVHNRSAGSSDMVIDIELDGRRSNPDSPPFIVTTPVTIKSRSFDGMTWSALTEADFTVDTIPAASDNLAITEILYNPAGASAAEIAAGFTDGDQFEFLQIKNLANQALDLHGVYFSDGIGFNYSVGDVRALAPGGFALIVADLPAFRFRYGNGFDSIIAGEYSGQLRNSGEQVRLIDAADAPIHDFSYGTAAPWPSLSALDGLSIQIINPDGDHNDGANWQASAEVGGTPGGSILSFAAWQTANLTDPELSAADADPDNDRLDNFSEFALGTPPLSGVNGIPLPRASQNLDGHMILEFTRQPGERAVEFSLEASSDLQTWTESATASGAPITNPDGTITSKLRDPIAATGRRYLRLKMSSP
ncbi:MAG: hypothetical protein ACI8XO_001026 [Verrucomicrobiales bacterium]|jgi:hypothetical protein